MELFKYGYNDKTNTDVLHMCQLVPIEVELNAQRIKLLQSIAQHPEHSRQLVAATWCNFCQGDPDWEPQHRKLFEYTWQLVGLTSQ